MLWTFWISLCQEGEGMGSFLDIHCLWKNICRICRWILMLKVNCEMVDPEDLEQRGFVVYLKPMDRKLYKWCWFISCSKSAGCSLKAFGLLLCWSAKQETNCGVNMTSYKCIFVLYSAGCSCRSLHAVPCHCLIRALLIHRGSA